MADWSDFATKLVYPTRLSGGPIIFPRGHTPTPGAPRRLRRASTLDFMSASIVSRPCLAAAAASRARLVSRAARASTASSSSNDKLHARAHPIQVRGLAQIARAKKGGFMAEMEEAKAEESGAKVEFTLPLAIQKYPHASLRNDNKIVGVFDSDLEKLAQAMFKIMYDTEGVGLAAPQVGVNYRMMVYNEAGEPGRGKEVVLVNPKIVKFSKTKDLFEEGCLSFPKIYADVEVRPRFEFPTLVPFLSLSFSPPRGARARVREREPVSANNNIRYSQRVRAGADEPLSNQPVRLSHRSMLPAHAHDRDRRFRVVYGQTRTRRPTPPLSGLSFDRSFRSSRSLCDIPPASSSRVPSETHQRAGGGAEPAGQEVQDDPRRLRGQGVSARVRPPRRGAVSRQDDGRGSGYGSGRARRPDRSAPGERTQGRVIRESRRKVSFDCDEGHYKAIVMRDSPRPSSLVVRGSLIARRFVRLSDFIGEIFR